MSQSRIFAATDESTAKDLLPLLELLLEDKGYPVAAFENVDCPQEWEISIYVESSDTSETYKLIRSLSIECGLELEFNQEEIPDIDWVSLTQSQLHPVRAGRIIVFGSHDKHVPAPNDIAVCLDAGMAFGTGHHGTTAGCLFALDRLSKRKKYRNILDLGTGSGILAIAAAKIHWAAVTAADNDRIAVETAQRNMRLNEMTNRVRCVVSEGLHNRYIGENSPFDLVFANILAKPLKRMARDIARNTAPGGHVILSGLLPHQKSMITATYRSHSLTLEHSFVLDNWLTLILHKPAR